jgi:hypothetical protein
MKVNTNKSQMSEKVYGEMIKISVGCIVLLSAEKPRL